MATVILNPVVTSISGTIGRMVFYKRYGKTIMRSWIMPPNPNTSAQSKNRDRFRQAMISWQGLPDEVKADYNRRARKLSMSGHNLFISRYMKPGDIGNSENTAKKDANTLHFALSNGSGTTNALSNGVALSKNGTLSGPFCPETAIVREFALSNGLALSENRALSNAESGLPLRHRSVSAGEQGNFTAYD